MKLKSTKPTQSNSVSPRIEATFGSIRKIPDLLASLAFAAVLFLAQSNVALAATAPSLGTLAPYGIAAEILTNTAAGSSTSGRVCYTTSPATAVGSGGIDVPCAASVFSDQAAALAILNGVGQGCVPLPVNPLAGNIAPGCYETAGAINIAAGTTVTLTGSGVYIFRSTGGAINTEANSQVLLAGGACAGNVFWTGSGATTLGANSTFVGNILDNAGITIGAGTSLIGRALAVFAGGTVTTDTDTITRPFACPPVPVLATTTISTQASASVPVGGAVNDTAVLGGGTGVPQGTITYRLYGPNDATCSGAAVFATTTSVDGTGSYPSPGFTPSSAGTYRWIASYGGDSTNAASTGACNDANESVVVTAIGGPGSGSISGIPTLSEWAMILLAGLLAIGAFAARRRKQI
jgi:hypothetical protein